MFIDNKSLSLPDHTQLPESDGTFVKNFQLGNLLLTGDEKVKAERQRAEAERQRAETIEQENARLREQLRALGVDPDTLR